MDSKKKSPQVLMPICYGIHWDASAPECARCLAVSTCEGLTRAKAVGSVLPETVTSDTASESEVIETRPEPDVVDVESGEEQDMVSPIDHLLRSIEGKYERDESEADGLRTVKFRNGKGTLVVRVAISDAGRIKCQSAKSTVVLDSLESVEHAEEVLHELLG